MRKILFFLPLFAALVLTGCSNDDDLGSKDDEQKNDGYGYVAVNIVQPKSTGTRANDADKFQDGTDDENKAEKGLFFVYDQAGSTLYGGVQEIILTNGGTPTASKPYVEKIYQAVLVIDGVKDKPTDAYQIVCVLNAPDGLKTSLGTTPTLTNLKEKIDEYGAHDAGKFIMTNSVYSDGGTDPVLGAVVTEDNLATSAAAAKNNPVDIYVERVVAKVIASSANFSNTEGAKPAVNGTEKALTIKVTGIEVANIAEKSYLFKNIENINISTWTWNDVDNRRSYWETVPAVATPATATSLTFKNKSYANIATDGFDISTYGEKLTEYIQPNTYQDQKTAILVTAQLMDGDKPADLAYIRGGYTTKAGALNIVAEYLKQNKYYKKTVTGTEADTKTEYTSLMPDDLEWVNNEDLKKEGSTEITGLKRYEVVARVKKTVTGLCQQNADGKTYRELTDATEINTLLAALNGQSYVARIFTDGKCYYFVNIEQTPVVKDNGYTGTDPLEGVIRNHIYKLTLNSIKGIGTPVFDPDDIIIPEKPKDENLWFLAARVNVLKWRIVKQTVDFNGN